MQAIELVQSSDFLSFLARIELHRPAMFRSATVEELVDLYGGKLSAHQLTSW